MQHQSKHLIAALVVVQSLWLAGCGGDSADPVPLPASLAAGNGLPEDIIASGSTAYVYNATDGSILQLDLANGGKASVFAAAATDEFSSAWGLRVVASKNWLVSIQNRPYDFNPADAHGGRVVAFDLGTHAKVRSWNMPDQFVGNSVDVDKQGNLYVGDAGPDTRILKIDTSTDVVSTWATDSRWALNGFGIGGLVYSGTGLYASHNNVLWYIAINADGTAAGAVPVHVDGDPAIAADGMSWDGGTIYYAENDAFVPGAHGVVYRVSFTSATSATRTAIQGGLFDPSGVTTARVDGQAYLLVNESQAGFLFGTEQGSPSLPYQVKVIKQ